MKKEEKLKIIRNLQEMTGVGIATCKKALIQKDFDIEKAIEYIENTTIVVKRVSKESLNQNRL